MEPNMKLSSAKLPRALGALAHSNQFLKIINLVSFAFSFLMLALAFYQATKPPVVLALNSHGLPYEASKLPKPEDEITLAIRAYMELRYKWEPKTVTTRLAQAEAFILPQSRKAYEAAVANVSRFSIEKNVSQRVYPNEPMIDLDHKAALITGDRITVVQGLKAAGELRLELSFEIGPRTPQNPWGVYITKEREQ